MKNHAGLSVYLETHDGVRIKEYDNGIDNEPHPDFDGSIGTRQVGVKEGTAIKVKITVADFFNLYTADGLWIEICAGYPIVPLDFGESSQCWWIQNRQRSVSRTYEFSFFTNFDDNSNPHIPFVVASADQSTYANASHRWVLGEDQALGNASLLVYIIRSKQTPSESSFRTRLQPKEGWCWPEPLAPKIIHHRSARALNSENGAPFIFEFRNMGLDGIDANREEADEEFGLAYDTATDSEESAEIEGEEEEEDGDEDEEDVGIFNATSSDREEAPNANDLYEIDFDPWINGRPGNKTRNPRSGTRMKKRKRSRLQHSQGANYDMRSGIPPDQKTRMVAVRGSERWNNTECNPNEVDDDEDLPQVRKPRTRISRRESTLPSKLRQMTQPISQSESVPAALGNANTFSMIDKDTNTQRNSHPGASFVSKAAPSNTYNTTALTSPSDPRWTGGSRFDNTVDLTQEPDGVSVKVKLEAPDNDLPEQKSGTNTKAPVVDDDDEEDLEDALQEIQIKRKLRAMKKKKQAAGRMGA